MPQEASVAFLQQAKKEKRLAIEDFRDAFGVTHEAAALRFTNLATSHLDMTLHFLRVAGDGALLKGYENDGLPLPTDVTGSIEGQWVCKKWSARTAFEHTNRTTENYQYTDTPGRHVLVRHADRAHGCRGVLDHRRRAVRAGEVVPRARDHACGPSSTLPRRVVLPPRARRARRALGRARPGRAPACTRTCCRRCRRARSRASTTPRCTSSSRRTPTSRPGAAGDCGLRGISATVASMSLLH